MPAQQLATIVEPAAILAECETCGGCGRLCDGDPRDPATRDWRCHDCNGEGVVPALCDCCREYVAVEMVPGDRYPNRCYTCGTEPTP